jgi:hypothetical protein
VALVMVCLLLFLSILMNVLFLWRAICDRGGGGVGRVPVPRGPYNAAPIIPVDYAMSHDDF